MATQSSSNNATPALFNQFQGPPQRAYSGDMNLQQIDRLSVITGENDAEADDTSNDLASSSKKRSSDALGYPRKRATIACELCRGRKSRCDGARPRCKLCTDLRVECVYREPGIKLTAGEKLIMDELDKMKAFLQATLGGDRGGPVMDGGSPRTSDIMQGSRENAMATITGETNSGLGAPRAIDRGPIPFSSPTLQFPQKLHTTPALDLLRWPKIEALVSRPPNPQSLLQMEFAREPLRIDSPLSLDLEETSTSVQAFFERVNIWYACVNPYEWAAYYQKAQSMLFREGPESCVVLLVLALGSAVSPLPKAIDSSSVLYFSAAWSLLPNVITSNSIISLQCTMLAAAYLFYLVRPLEAWTLISSSSMKMQLLLRVPGAISEQSIRLSERLYWNLLLTESDVLTQLDLPSSGIAQFEENVALPTFFQEFPSSPGRDELWYFHAAIDLRRLRTRISNEISAKESSPPDILEPISHDFDIQLYDWYETLPMTVRFPLNRGLLIHPAQTVLRLRYFAARTAIFRPYVLAVLEEETRSRIPFIHDNCRKCLESCLRQLEDISIDRSGHVPYLWQSALSLVSQSLLVMGATMSPSLLQFLPPPEHLGRMLIAVVEEMERYAELAPSLRLCAEVLREAEETRREFLHKSVTTGFGGR